MKFSDFGMARQWNHKTTMTQKARGTSLYLSPEYKKIKNNSINEIKFNPEKSDIFPLGITFL